MRAFLGYLLVDSLQPRKKQPVASNPGNRQRLPAVHAVDIDQLDGSAAQNDALRILASMTMSENGEIDGAGLEDTHPMEPDHEACYRALSTRDARFDGRFFIAVRTTRIYCRPICPARTPKRENVTFFTTASAAQEAGCRPCLRCRPESSPDLGAWRGTSNTVSRALTLIGEGALDGEAVDALAERLGVGERQLRRLFRQHLGASPIAVRS
jgi:methylphosphotriester-DNA--protein-cysteine methyltransferase